MIQNIAIFMDDLSRNVYLGIYNRQSLILKSTFGCSYRFASMKYMQYAVIKILLTETAMCMDWITVSRG